MKIRLTRPQMNMLIEVKNHFQWEKELEFESHTSCVVLRGLNEDDVIDLRELCADYLLKVGFNGQYETNEKGKELEVLVDKLLVQ